MRMFHCRAETGRATLGDRKLHSFGGLRKPVAGAGAAFRVEPGNRSPSGRTPQALLRSAAALTQVSDGAGVPS